MSQFDILKGKGRWPARKRKLVDTQRPRLGRQQSSGHETYSGSILDEALVEMHEDALPSEDTQ